MNPVQVIGGFLSGFLNYLQQKRTDARITSAMDMAEAVNQWVGRAITAIITYDEQEFGAVGFSAQYAKQIGHDLEQIQGTHERYWNRLFDVIIPKTLAHAVGYVYSDGIVPLRVFQRAALKRFTDDEGRLNVLEGWRQQWVDPNIATLEGFRANVIANYFPVVNVLRDWLTHPGDFGDWAAAPITGPLIAYLADQTHQQSRDNLSRIMVAAWQEVPNDVWESVLQWVVTTK